MSPYDVQACLKKLPFDPFRIVMKSGRAFDVRHPKILVVGRTNIHYFVYRDPEMDFHDEMHCLGLDYIAQIEACDPPAAVPNF
jgi:hypothetical protein